MGDFYYRILVVDDDERIRRASEETLSHFGYEVRIANDGFEALALLRHALPDLIISDLKMPNMSGFELLSVVRRRVSSDSGNCDNRGISGGDPEGLLADALFHKGEYSPEELFKQISSLLEQSPIRPHIPKSDKAPVWIPRNGTYVVLTCPECLRSFSISEDEAEKGSGELTCIYCDTKIHFKLGPGKMTS